MNSRVNQLLNCLNDGEFHSGEALGSTLGVSRAAINQHINKLLELGVDIYSVHGKGYKLATPLELLDQQAICKAAQVNDQNILVESVVTSSNDSLRDLLTQGSLPAGYAVIAEAQTQGRGRRGKRWFSPFGCNLYISFYWPIAEGINGAMGLSLVAGLSLVKALEQLGVSNAGVKWPNDVYIDNQKVAGILVELESNTDGSANSIIGIGLNLAMPESTGSQIDQRWTDLRSQLSKPVSRNVISGCIYREVVAGLNEFDNNGLQWTRQQWPPYDVYFNKAVTLTMGQRSVIGICRGIDENGAVLLETNGNTVRYFGGEISLRATDVTY